MTVSRNRITASDSSSTSCSSAQERYSGASLPERVTALASERNPGAAIFVSLFCASMAPDDFDEIALPERWAEEALEAFNLLSAPRLREQTVVSVKHCPASECEDERCVIQVLHDDKPFLVDSVSEELNRLGIQIYSISHPMVTCRRDAQGALLEASVPARGVSSSPEGCVTESFQYYRVSPLATDAERAEVEACLRRVLSAVDLAVNDWQPVADSTEGLRLRFNACAGAYRPQVSPALVNSYDAEAAEISHFLTWLGEGNFVFLGYASFRFDENGERVRIPGAGLGLLREGCEDIGALHAEKNAAFTPPFDENGFRVLHITKTDRRSIVHRPVHMDCIAVRLFDENGEPSEEHRIVGLFTSVVYYQSAQGIPLIRRKIALAVERSGFLPQSHNIKALRSALEAFPRDELFQIDAKQLFDISMGVVGLSMRPRVRLFMRRCDTERYVSCIVFVPRDKMSTRLRYKIQDILCAGVGGSLSNHYTDISEQHLARLQIIIKLENPIPCDERALEKAVAAVTHDWDDRFAESLSLACGTHEGRRLHVKYAGAFPEDYAARFDTAEAAQDAVICERLTTQKPCAFRLQRSDYRGRSVLELKIFNLGGRIPLAETLPLAEHAGLHALDDFTYEVVNRRMDASVWVHVLRAEDNIPEFLPFEQAKALLEEALTKTRAKESCDDPLNALTVRAGLDVRKIAVLRAYGKYLKQARFSVGHSAVRNALLNNPAIAALLADLFDTRFDPALPGDRDAAEQAVSAKLTALLADVQNASDDKALRAYLELIRATVRTNVFRTDDQDEPRKWFSFKFISSGISFLPKPAPYAEIFVFSPRVEGIHLRGGKVARGGLRWSDRAEDFRTEVLQLVKAQMTKNAIIIPVGSKGGFILKQAPTTGGRAAFLAEGQECYRIFLRGLLDLTDNLRDGQVMPPKQVVRHDGDDPYLVVAADKGTATFSDIANGVAAEYGFWLGDAFASGGSAGYDHKKMGITARGGWVSVRRHFREIGVDVNRDPVTVIGIGDMAGDVFGNGLLLSRSLKLLAAFNHMHIFLDPTPDAEASFKERQRLFDLPSSTWDDYNKALISKGGGVFLRSAKEIPVSPEIAEWLGVREKALAPEALIRHILKARVDLLWNGGIGTYVKAKTETNDDAGDRANDTLRVNGEELRCKVVGEGGNLGFTQRGRIEYALAGGRLNTDAIDNSGGVDCSDHEVNIKIALGLAVEADKLNRESRDVLLAEMTDEVADLVLLDNTLQTQGLTIAEHQGVNQLEVYSRLIDFLTRKYTLDREVEFLPSKQDIARRQYEGKGLTRPELSVLMAYCKLYLYESLLHSDLPDDPAYEADLLRYFPIPMQRRFREELLRHPLRREIIATVASNSAINRMGVAGFFRLLEGTGGSPAEITRAYLAARDIFNLRAVWSRIEKLGVEVSTETRVELFLSVQRLIHRSVTRCVRALRGATDSAGYLTRAANVAAELKAALPGVLAKEAAARYAERKQHYVDSSVPEDLAHEVACAESMAPALDIFSAAEGANVPAAEIARVYYLLGERLGITRLREALTAGVGSSYWAQISVQALAEELYQEQERLTHNAALKLCGSSACHSEKLAAWEADCADDLARFDRFLDEMKAQEEEINIAVATVALRKLKEVDAKSR